MDKIRLMIEYLGFLGLLGVAVLIIIYVLKPNYQQKFVSSTYIWKLSLRYRKKKVSADKFRNILIFICQMLVLIICSFILTQPILLSSMEDLTQDKIFIIDASADMCAAQVDGITRFERAVSQAKEEGMQAIELDGKVSVILAGQEASLAISNEVSSESFGKKMDALIAPDTFACTFGNADLEEAFRLAQGVLTREPMAEVLFFTASRFQERNLGEHPVVIRDVSASEWNAGILSCDVQTIDNFCVFSVEIACFGRDEDISLSIFVEIGRAHV